MARRSVQDIIQKKKEFIENYKKSMGLITIASRHTNIERDTFYRWMKDDLDFKKEIDSIKEYVYDFVESKLIKLIDEGNVTAIIFYCKTKMKERGYVERAEIANEHQFSFTFKDRIIDEIPNGTS